MYLETWLGMRETGSPPASMTGSRMRHLPVMSDGRIIGVRSIEGVQEAISEAQHFIISVMELHIAS